MDEVVLCEVVYLCRLSHDNFKLWCIIVRDVSELVIVLLYLLGNVTRHKFTREHIKWYS